jgi:hypothetical protein
MERRIICCITVSKQTISEYCQALRIYYYTYSDTSIVACTQHSAPTIGNALISVRVGGGPPLIVVI